MVVDINLDILVILVGCEIYMVDLIDFVLVEVLVCYVNCFGLVYIFVNVVVVVVFGWIDEFSVEGWCKIFVVEVDSVFLVICLFWF